MRYRDIGLLPLMGLAGEPLDDTVTESSTSTIEREPPNRWRWRTWCPDSGLRPDRWSRTRRVPTRFGQRSPAPHEAGLPHR